MSTNCFNSIIICQAKWILYWIHTVTHYSHIDPSIQTFVREMNSYLSINQHYIFLTNRIIQFSKNVQQMFVLNVWAKRISVTVIFTNQQLISLNKKIQKQNYCIAFMSINYWTIHGLLTIALEPKIVHVLWREVEILLIPIIYTYVHYLADNSTNNFAIGN